MKSEVILQQLQGLMSLKVRLLIREEMCVPISMAGGEQRGQ